MTDCSRQFCLQFFRAPARRNNDMALAPIDPSTSWVGETQMLTGLNAFVRPPGCLEDRIKARTGRVIRWEVNRTLWDRDPVVYATFCANIIDTEPPPYSGGQPVDFQQFRNPVYTFTDGTKGRWEPTRYPQLFDSHRPWLGLFRAPALVTINDPIYYQNVLYFWVWNSGSDPLQGGWWRQKEFDRLFEKRKLIEDDAKRSIQNYADIVHLDSYTLPYIDDLERHTAAKWTTFREGRDALAHTLSYIAEVEAFVKWVGKMAEFKALKATGDQFLNSACLEGDQTLAGTWAPTISSTEEWEFLLYCRVPVYMILKVPEGHPLYVTAVPGNLDNDERFRRNAFDYAFGRGNNPRQLQGWTWTSCDLSLESRSEDLPEAITTPSDKTQGATHPTTSWRRPIYRDPEANRTTDSLPRGEALQRYKERVHFASLPPCTRILNAAVDQHPLLHVIPEERSMGITYYEELKHESESWYWPAKLDDLPLDAGQSFRYRFNFEFERICILSNHSFPGREPSFCQSRFASDNRIVDIQDKGALSPLTRNYYCKEPSSNNESPVHVWKADLEVATDSAGVAGHRSEVLLDLPYNPLPQAEEEEQTDPVVLLQLGRQAIREHVKRRFFLPRKDYEAGGLHAWQVPQRNGAGTTWSGLFCFPVRIANLSGHTTFQDVRELIDHFAVEIVLYGWYSEVDTTCTFDLGLRYAEDAHQIWSIHGQLYNGRHIEVYPITRITGNVCVLSIPSVGRSVQERIGIADQTINQYHRLVGRAFNFFDGGSTHLGQELVIMSGTLRALRMKPDQGAVFRKPHRITGRTNSLIPIAAPTPPPTSQPDSAWSFDIPHVLGVTSHGHPLSSYQAHFIPAPIPTPVPAPIPTPIPALAPASRREEGEYRRPKKKKFPDRSQDQNREKARDMTTDERHLFKRAVRRRAQFIRSGWKGLGLLPELTTTSTSIVGLLTSVWEWEDTCLELMRSFRDKSGNAAYDYSPFEDAFGSLSRLRNLYGAEARACANALREYRELRN
jgi:hypothetical protein